MEYALTVFLEAVWHNSLIPLAHHTTYAALKAFGNPQLSTYTALAIAGAIVGHACNWGIGRAFLALHQRGKLKLHAAQYAKAQQVFNRYLVFLLLLTWAPAGGVVPAMAGMLSTPLRFVMPLVVLGQVGYYVLGG